MSLFEACDLSVAYDGQGEGAPVRLEGISFGLEPGIVYDLTGPSGARLLGSATGIARAGLDPRQPLVALVAQSEPWPFRPF